MSKSTQPAIAGAYIPESLGAGGSYSNFAWGMTAYVISAGFFTFVFDKAMAAGSYIVIATPINTAGSVSISAVTTAGTSGSNAFNVNCTDKTDAAIACGLMVLVIPIPKST